MGYRKNYIKTAIYILFVNSQCVSVDQRLYLTGHLVRSQMTTAVFSTGVKLLPRSHDATTEFKLNFKLNCCLNTQIVFEKFECACLCLT